jgi:hypothetical protein
MAGSGGHVASQLIKRLRRLGIEILGTWDGFAMPSVPMAVLAAFLVSRFMRACRRAGYDRPGSSLWRRRGSTSPRTGRATRCSA